MIIIRFLPFNGDVRFIAMMIMKLDLRLAVVEMIREITRTIENIPAGSTITSATQSNGIWTLVLSSGQTLTINPSAAGGGTSLEVVEKEHSIVITINDKEYELPLGTGFRSLIYVPEFVDGEVHAGSNGRVNVKFLVKPALTETLLIDGLFHRGGPRVAACGKVL